MMNFLLLVVLLLFCGCEQQSAKDDFSAEIFIRNHKFEPNIINVPSGKRIRLVINNQDDTPEEFESVDLFREKMIPAKSSVHVVIAPLKPGTYKFFGDFHQDTAQGQVISIP